jgi:hypothetical protein
MICTLLKIYDSPRNLVLLVNTTPEEESAIGEELGNIGCWKPGLRVVSYETKSKDRYIPPSQLYSGMQKECTKPNLVTQWIAMSKSQPILNWSCPKFVCECTYMNSTSDKDFKEIRLCLDLFVEDTFYWLFFTEFWQDKWWFHFTVWRVNDLLLLLDEGLIYPPPSSKVLKPYSHLLHHKGQNISVHFLVFGSPVTRLEKDRNQTGPWPIRTAK